MERDEIQPDAMLLGWNSLDNWNFALQLALFGCHAIIRVVSRKYPGFFSMSR